MGDLVVSRAYAAAAAVRRWLRTRGAQWAVVFLFALTLVFGGLNLLYTARYVSQYEKHSCQALEILTAIPVPRPSDPAADPSRETNWKFHNALLYWQRSDGC
jgi:hypothetical protein